LYAQAGHTAEFTHVVGDEGQVGDQGMGGNLRVECADRLASVFERGPHGAIGIGSGGVPGQNDDALQEALDLPFQPRCGR